MIPGKSEKTGPMIPGKSEKTGLMIPVSADLSPRPPSPSPNPTQNLSPKTQPTKLTHETQKHVKIELMDMRKAVMTLIILITVSTLMFAGIDPLINLNPQIPFAFTYEYRTPREWQVEVLTGTSLDIAAFSTAATGSIINMGTIGLKFGIPGNLVLVGSVPWIGAYYSVDEGQFMPEFDVSLNVPVFSGNNIVSSAPAISLSTVLKKSLPPVRFSVGNNILFSYKTELEQDEPVEQETVVGENYIGTGIEWQINPYLKTFGEFRYELTEIIYFKNTGYNIDLLTDPANSNKIITLGGEYTLNLQRFSLKTNAAYSILLRRNMRNTNNTVSEETPLGFSTHSVSVGISFLFPFPIDSQDWENPYSPVGEVP